MEDYNNIPKPKTRTIIALLHEIETIMGCGISQRTKEALEQRLQGVERELLSLLTEI